MIDSTPWANRPHVGRPTVPLALTSAQRADIEMAMRPEKAERRIVVRGQALLFMADGVPASDIAMVLGVHERTVFKWRRRFECELLRCSSKGTHLCSREGTHPAITTFPRRRRCLSTRAGYRRDPYARRWRVVRASGREPRSCPSAPARIPLRDAHRPCADARYRVVMARVGDHATGGISRAASEPEAPTIGAWRGTGVMKGGDVEARSRVTIEARRRGGARPETKRSDQTSSSFGPNAKPSFRDTSRLAAACATAAR